MPAPTPDATELRAAALSDLRHPPTTPGASLLDLLLPDVPGAPYGGTATPAQRAATAQATGIPVPERYSTGQRPGPVHLREILRRWAESQLPPTALQRLQEILEPLVQEHLRARDAPNNGSTTAQRNAARHDGQAQGIRTALVQIQRELGSDNAAGLRGTIQKLQTLDDSGRPLPKEPDLLARLQDSLTRARRSR